MLRAALQRLTHIPSIYAASQYIAGVHTVHARLSNRLRRSPLGVVLDVGGGMGLVRPLCQNASAYTCLEYAPRSLAAFHRAFPADGAALGDAAHLPFADASFDTVLCIMMLHHLHDAAARGCIAQSARVLRPGGRMFLVEPLWSPERWRGRMLWRLDRGAYPRSMQENIALIEALFTVVYKERFSVHHEYVLCEACLYGGHAWNERHQG